MAFQIKDFASVTASCINWMRAVTTKVTDFNVGSVVRTILEAAAAEIEEYYLRMYIGLKEAIPVSVYNSFNFSALSAAPASGLIRVTVTSSASPVLISAGTTFTTPGKSASYVATLDVTVAAGNTFGDVPVSCVTAGAAGNIASGAAFTPSPVPVNYVSASNAAAFVSGQDTETDDQRKLRFNAFIASLNRSTNAALVYGAKLAVRLDASGNQLERVNSAITVEPWVADPTQPVGWVKVYVHNGTGATSAGLVTLVHNVLYGYTDALGNAIPGWKAAGVQVDCFAAGDQSLNVTGVITSMPGYDHAAHITAAVAAISAYLSGLAVGEKAIYARLVQLVMDIDGVSNFVLSAPTVDTTPAATTKILPGVLAIS